MTLQPTVDEMMPSNPGAWSTYRLFGFTIASNFAFANRLAPGHGDVDLTFTWSEQAPCPISYPTAQPDYISPYHTPDGQSILHVFRRPEYDILHFVEVADFYVWPDRIVCHLLNPTYANVVEIHLLGRVMAYWLERRDILAFHAAAAVVDGRTVAFLESNGGGKSSMAAALVQAGYPLLTDDIMPVEVRDGSLLSHAGYPQMRMWPDQAKYFLGHYRSLDKIHPLYSKRRAPIGTGVFGEFCASSQPLGCLYLPGRCSGTAQSKIEIVQLSQQEALIELIRHSFLVELLIGVGWHHRRMAILAQIARQVPLRRIKYPSGYDQLPYVREAVLADLATPSPSWKR